MSRRLSSQDLVLFPPVRFSSLLTILLLILRDVMSRNGHRVPRFDRFNFLLHHRASLRGAVTRSSPTVFLLSTYSLGIAPDTGWREIYCWMPMHGAGLTTPIASSSPAHFGLRSIGSGPQRGGTGATHWTSLLLRLGAGFHRGGLLPLSDGF